MGEFGLVAIVYFGVLLVFLFLGVWIAIVLGIAGLIGLQFIMGDAAGLMATYSFSALNNFVLSALPMFVLMGEVLSRTGMAGNMYHGFTPVLQRVPGGLLHTNALASAFFGAVCGSGIAGAATMGTIALPELKKRGYDMPMACATLSAAGPIAMLIPPSIVMILYGSLVGASVAWLFMGGVVPGVMMTLLFMVVIWIMAKRNPSLAPPAKEEEKLSLARSLLMLRGSLPIILLAGFIFFAIYFGVATPTEVGGVGAVVAFIMAGVTRRLNWPVFKEILTESLWLTAMMMFLFIGAEIFSYSLSASGMTRFLSQWAIVLPGTPLMKLGLIYCLYLALGMFVDVISMILITCQ